jgi:hypothetical protein
MKWLRKKSENNPTHNSLKKINNLHINLTNEVKDHYNENYQSLKKEIEEETKRWKAY